MTPTPGSLFNPPEDLSLALSISRSHPAYDEENNRYVDSWSLYDGRVYRERTYIDYHNFSYTMIASLD